MALSADFKDSFTTSVVSPCWANYSYNGGTATGAGPGLVLNRGAAAGGGGWIQTLDEYDMRGSTATIHLTSLPSLPGTVNDAAAFFQFTCGVIGDGTPEFVYKPSTGELRCNGLNTEQTLTGTIPLYWRFRGEPTGTALHLETAPDGTTWTHRGQWNQGGVHGSATLEYVLHDLQSAYCTTTVTTYNGGGTPCCDSYPCPEGTQRARSWILG